MAELFFDPDEDVAPPPSREEATSPPTPARPRRRRWPWFLGVLLLLVVGVGAVGANWLRARIDPPGDPGRTVAVDIPLGSSTASIGERLVTTGVITDATIWRFWVRSQGEGPFDAGTYVFRENSSFEDVVDVLEGDALLPPADFLTIREGLTLPEVVEAVDGFERLDSARFTELLASGTVRSVFQPPEVTSLEGLLFPETYRIEESDDEADLLTRMVADLDEVATELGYADSAARVGLTPFQTIVVASLIEAEAKVPDDRAKISRVVQNRLAAGMTLGIDATVYFALGRTDNQGLTATDLEVDSPYNTRRYGGLPPGPIALPGRASLEAALNPAPGPWLYYVLADESGAHAFSEDYDQFLEDKEAAEAKGLL